MLAKHIELHKEKIIYVTGQSVVPISWIGRQSVNKKQNINKISKAKKQSSKNVLRNSDKYKNDMYLTSSSDDLDKPVSSGFQYRKRHYVENKKDKQTIPSKMVKELTNKNAQDKGIEKEESSVESLSDNLTTDISDRNQNTNLFTASHEDYYDGDRRLPIVMRASKGIKTKDALDYIINEGMGKEKLASVVPTDIRENVSFLVNTKSIGSWKDLLSDDMGAWKTTCVANRFYKWDIKGELVTVQNNEPDCLIVFRHQYVNVSSPDLHRVIIRVGYSKEQMRDTVFLQYYFDNEEHSVTVKPHGNTKKIISHM